MQGAQRMPANLNFTGALDCNELDSLYDERAGFCRSGTQPVAGCPHQSQDSANLVPLETEAQFGAVGLR